MEETLRKLGLSDETIADMADMCPEIEELTEEEIAEKINLLRDIGCDDEQIADIIASNPFYLDCIDTDVINLTGRLREYGFTDIASLLEGNPFILNLDDFEVDEYMKKRLYKGEKLQNIVEDVMVNTYLLTD